eukprot:3096106-Prymnesium_polylepis.1
MGARARRADGAHPRDDVGDDDARTCCALSTRVPHDALPRARGHTTTDDGAPNGWAAQRMRG